MPRLSEFFGLLESAQGRQSFGDIDFLLKAVLEFTDCDGIILWRQWHEKFLRQDGSLHNSKTIRAAGNYFRSSPDARVFRALSEYGETANGIVTQQTWSADAMKVKDAAEREIAERFGYFAVTGVPFGNATADENSWQKSIAGSLNFYRTEPRHADDSELAELVDCAQMFRYCFTSMVESVGPSFIEGIERILAAHGTDTLRVEVVTRQLERKIADTIPCHEVCIHVRGDGAKRNAIHSNEGIWPWVSREHRRDFESGEGITGGAFKEGKTFVVGDILGSDYATTARYGSLTPFTQDHAEKENILSRDVFGQLAPVGVLAVPLIDRRLPIGVVRCAAKAKSPHFFGVHEVFYLEQAAALIGDWFGRCIGRVREVNATTGTLAIVRTGRDFASMIRGAIRPGSPEGIRFDFAALVETWQSVLPEGTSVCLCRRTSGTLRFRRSSCVPRRTEQADTINVDPNFNWEHYSRDLETYFLDQPKYSHWPALPWPLPNESLVFPLGALQEVTGAVEIVPPATGVLSEQDKRFCFLFANLAFFASVIEHYVVENNRAQVLLRESQDEQEKAFRTLAHQVNTPLSTALGAMNLLSRISLSKAPDAELMRQAAAIAMPSVRRAFRVAQRMKAIAELTSDGEVRPVSDSTVPFILVKRHIEEISTDHREKAGLKRMSISLTEQPPLKGITATVTVRADIDLLDQAFEALLENAIKYGDAGSAIEVTLSHGHRNLLISVRNSGRKTPLRQDEVTRINGYGWRMDRAAAKSKPGWGVGLYVASQLMQAQHGNLNAVATSEKGITIFSLSVPRAI